MLLFKRCHLVLIKFELRFVRIHYLTGRRRLVTSHRCRLVAGLVPGTASLVPGLVAVSSPPESVATAAASLVVPTIYSTFSSKSAIAKFRNARQTKMTVIDSHIQHRHITLKIHCT